MPLVIFKGSGGRHCHLSAFSPFKVNLSHDLMTFESFNSILPLIEPKIMLSVLISELFGHYLWVIHIHIQTAILDTNWILLFYLTAPPSGDKGYVFVDSLPDTALLFFPCNFSNHVLVTFTAGSGVWDLTLLPMITFPNKPSTSYQCTQWARPTQMTFSDLYAGQFLWPIVPRGSCQAKGQDRRHKNKK